MLALLQRVTKASVVIDENQFSAINAGLLVFACCIKGDEASVASLLANKIANLRIFADANGKMNHSLLDNQLECLVVSQFTLAADCLKGKRPSFSKAADPADAERLCQQLVEQLTEQGIKVANGKFGADMQISLINDGPVTILLDSSQLGH